ncbi:hypothetical protein GPECTOR_108g183 [Gonium pectorale]|uniref:Uncharacterized protein n=1 Tax=Gonium pectorale TaxID=33097 RepID=A0A150FZH8_GONPE|nr:hypothetical protein GPECTOR_108g183 [Gonium pectorale]|eukprot:KXZ42988.1 hypothetical protein GPECTOR_108g183 [Gonium pectorale]
MRDSLLAYCLKGTLGNVNNVKPSNSTFRIEVTKINGETLSTTRDMKDQGLYDTPRTTAYCLKGTLRNVNNVKPSNSTFRIEVTKVCTGTDCAAIPDPATVFTSPKGHIVWSVWTVQKMSVNGAPIRDHAWCPVQSAINLD